MGRPNVGKSTLINLILGQQVSIVTAKPQTTRNRVLAVHNAGPAQVIFLDTPGLHDPRGSLGRYMLEAADSAIAEADVCVWLIDASHRGTSGQLTPEEHEVSARLAASGLPILALPNKIDEVRDKKSLLPLLETLAGLPGVEEVVPIAAIEGDGVDRFLELLCARLPAAPWLYPEDMLSDRAERFFVAELIREALTDLTRQEVPYKSAVVIEQFVEETERCVIHATIHVERASQRGIVVGKGGKMVQAIGSRAREAAELLLGCPVDLRLHVDVTPGWTRDPAGLKKMGYE